MIKEKVFTKVAEEAVKKVDLFIGESMKEVLKKAVPAGLILGATQAVGNRIVDPIMKPCGEKLKLKLDELKNREIKIKKTKKVEAE